MAPNRLLIVDDERPFADLVARVATEMGFEVAVAGTPAEFLQELARWQPSLLVVDLQMPDMDGIQLLRQLAEQAVRCPIVLASGFDRRTLLSARRLAVTQGLTVAGTVHKPVRIAELRGLLQSLAAPTEAVDEFSPESLSAAIENNELCVLYQPIVDMRTRTMIGVEALARWTPQSGLPIPPQRFISVAEESGLIVRLTDRILEKVIAQAAAWHRSGAGLQTSVNLSVTCLHDLEYPDRLAERCRKAALPTEMLRLELTETATMQNAVRMLDVLTRVRLKGFELSLDDFGTGYSSLKLLQRLPVTEIKIDRSFVADMVTDGDSAVIVKTIVDMAHNLDLSVVAEGIEDEATLRMLEGFGCDLGQGYLFSRPAEADQIDAMAAAGAWTRPPTPGDVGA